MAPGATVKQKPWLTAGHSSLGVCPVCDQPITTDQRTAHRLVDGTPTRIHAVHLEENPR